ncbi:Os04g0517500 [Oryza sativa Japonica Group]|uniref:Os04g0517500 protein n=1 Tax=Oryza sativa subsp. japonica TaxID=39947 RepID=A0A0N7KJD3_ORYSJ|nr:Os04g0517500 [Oryza sativa Japonica Group]
MSEELKRDFEIGEEIGRGRFGVVHRCASRSTGEAYAVKSVDRSRLSDDLDRSLAALEPKLARLAAAGNPGVVQVHAVYEDDDWTHTVMDLCTRPDILDWVRLRCGKPVPEPDATAVVAQIAEALALCHRRGVAHRDVKPDNVLLDATGDGPPRVRLADFGSAAWVGDGISAEGARGDSRTTSRPRWSPGASTGRRPTCGARGWSCTCSSPAARSRSAARRPPTCSPPSCGAT